MALDESHQRFLQVIMSHGILEYSAAKTLHKHCCEVHKANYVDKLDDFVGVINKHLQPVFMQIRKGTDENNEKTYYALVNLAENDVAKMSLDYAENELELFRKTMDLIVDSDNGFASSTNILNLTDQLQTKKIKKKEVEQLLQRFVQDKWLIEKDGEYSLHARCVMEMEHYIKNTYQDIVKTCNICHNIAIQDYHRLIPRCHLPPRCLVQEKTERSPLLDQDDNHFSKKYYCVCFFICTFVQYFLAEHLL
ncbi:non-structural maintenance of chromosomes element 1 homolog isoform X2 [Hyperolius riggenbachi]|uniref:non-structural maintenance of chromosomes element 1 homolog isoform X2 n=1 Tax=Hyperolius riggenbachi TaxID=752182 RepID=UPI0035A2A774